MYKQLISSIYTPEQKQAMEVFAKEYRAYLDAGKTERECAAESARLAEAAGFRNLDELIGTGAKLQPGDKVYRVWMKKDFMAFVIGKQDLSAGMNILGAHVDSPRLDVKQNPLYEDSGFCYLDTHYYGGIKKYQWLATPLAIHGVVVLKDGTCVNVVVGEKDDDPVFCISDLLPHLASDQMGKSARDFVDGEALNLLVAMDPKKDTEKDPIKTAVLDMLKEAYGMEEEDFLSAELEIVPAGKSRDLGFDRSMILGYGHDDRVCAYPSMRAVMDYEGVPERTLCAILTDKEEIGSVGATGMGSHYFENTVCELVALTGDYCDLKARRALQNSLMLSSDVNAAYDPLYAGVFESKNNAYLGKGVGFCKYTGSRGKGGASDANPEFFAQMRKILDDAGVVWQTSEIGKVDAGGGGTIAYLCAKYGMQVVDCGVPVLSMHAPWETIAKTDLYEAYRGYVAFLKDAQPVV